MSAPTHPAHTATPTAPAAPTNAPEEQRDTGLACLAFIARFHSLAADEAALRHAHPPAGATMTEQELLRTAMGLGLKAKAASWPHDRMGKLPFPVMLQTREGNWCVLGGIREGKALVRDPRQPQSTFITEAELTAMWLGRVIMLGKQTLLPEALRDFNVSWFIPSVLKYRGLFAEVLVASFFLQLFGLVTPLFFQVVVDKVLVHKGLTTLDVLAVGFLGVAVLEAVLGGLRTWLFSHTAYRVDVMLGARLFNHLVRLPSAYFNTRRVGDSVARVRELETIRRFLTGSTVTLIIDICFTVIFFALMLSYSPLLTGIIAATIPFYIVLSLVVTPLLRNLLNEKFMRGAENQAFLVETVTGINTVKAMAVEPQFQRRWEDMLAGYVRAAFRADSLGNVAVQTSQFFSSLTTLLIIWVGARGVIEGTLTTGQLVAFNMMAQRISGPIMRLAKLWQDLQQTGISLKRLGDILNNPTEAGTTATRVAQQSLQGHVQLEGISFRYRPDTPYILDDISLTIAPGEILGIVGRSGSGKSTLTNLVQRMYIPERGRVLVDGHDLTLLDPAWLRRQIGVVLQENMLFNRTVRDNIALAEPGAPMERVMLAARLAGAHEFIMDLPEGYDTMVGEHGSTLSGGQRQRVAIARALFTNPRILIFDEATSALDYESEHIIQQNMRAICQGRTVIIIAHRLSTVMNCNRIAVIDKGSIIEMGSHDELIRARGYYNRLWAYQTQGNNPTPAQEGAHA